MKKFSYLLGMSLLSLSMVAGCSGEDPPATNPGGAGGGAAGGGAGGTGGGTAGGGAGGARTPTGTQLSPPASYTLLTGADATASATPAPAYYGTVCSTCHGPAGEGVSGLGPEIRHTPATYSNYVVRNGRPTPSLMTAYNVAAVSDADVLAIQNWLTTQPKPTTPQGLYLDFCGNCHGPMGGGGSTPWKAQGLPTATIIAKVRSGVGTDPSMRAAYMPAFGVDALTDAELTSIAQFLGGT
jgi:mono/diheme cytochrome c family protein